MGCQSNSATGTRPCNNFPALKASVDAAGKVGSLAGLGSATHLQLSCPARQYVEKVPSLFISILNKNKRKTPSKKKKKKKKKPPKKKKKKKKKKVPGVEPLP